MNINLRKKTTRKKTPESRRSIRLLQRIRNARLRRWVLTDCILLILVVSTTIYSAITGIVAANIRDAGSHGAVDAVEAEIEQFQAEEEARREAVDQIYNHSDSALVRTAVQYVGNEGGEPFWSWYGYGYRVEWCACFVSYCANETDLLGSNIPKFSYVPTGTQWFMDQDMYGAAGEYTPKAGDIVFFKDADSTDTSSDAANHVGIVAGVYEDRLYTIEGNHDDRCAKRNYKLTNKRLLGYGIVDADE